MWASRLFGDFWKAQNFNGSSGLKCRLYLKVCLNWPEGPSARARRNSPIGCLSYSVQNTVISIKLGIQLEGPHRSSFLCKSLFKLFGQITSCYKKQILKTLVDLDWIGWDYGFMLSPPLENINWPFSIPHAEPRWHQGPGAPVVIPHKLWMVQAVDYICWGGFNRAYLRYSIKPRLVCWG